MFVNFRQGLVRIQTAPNFISFSGSTVSLNVNTDPTIISFADQTTDYLFSENVSVSNAWIGPFVSSFTYWLYWDIDLRTGNRTFGSTTIAPLFGMHLPTTPAVGQHYFSYNDTTMRVWNGTTWTPVLRVFAGQLNNGSTLVPYSIGSQVNLNQGRNQGFMIFDQTGSPIKNNSNYFITTETIIYAQNSPLNNYKIEAVQVDGRAVMPIPKYSAVTWTNINQLGLASYTDYLHPAIGISVEDMSKDQIKKFVTNGYLTNSNWNFSDAPNTPVWVGLNGEITTTVPQTWSMQKLGVVVSSDTIFVNIESIVLLGNQIIFPSPTPTITVTPSVTRTPSITPTNTMTITPSRTVTITSTVTPTATLTMTPSVTNTMTPTVTNTSTVSPTITPTLTTTPTNTVTHTPTSTLTVTPTLTPIPSSTPTMTGTPVVTPTIAPT